MMDAPGKGKQVLLNATNQPTEITRVFFS